MINFFCQQDLQEKCDALSEQCRKYRKQIKLLAKKLKDAGGKIKLLLCYQVAYLRICVTSYVCCNPVLRVAEGRAIAQAVSHWLLTAAARV
jgi:hypothetical protein